MLTGPTNAPGVTSEPDVTGAPGEPGVVGMVGVPGLPGVVCGTGYWVPVPGADHLTGTGFIGSSCDQYMFRLHWSVDR